MVTNLQQLKEGTIVECTEGVVVEHKDNPNNPMLFIKGERYEVAWLMTLRILAVVKMKEGRVTAFYPLPDQIHLKSTWNLFNTYFKKIEGDDLNVD